MIINLKAVFLVLRPLGKAYALLMRVRSFLYKNGLLNRYRPLVPVISVGNLAMGGSGKTPCVIHLAKLLVNNGFKPAVVSRGYGGKATNSVNIVADGASILLDSYLAGDEPRLIAESVPGAAVLTGKDRRHPCRYATERLDCDIILLDDGFQHLRLLRDIDIVVFNASELYKNMHVFPGGFLREPLVALKRSDCFIISGCTTENQHKVIRFSRYLSGEHPHTSLFHAQFVPRCYVDPCGETYPLDHISSPAMAFCGIASPDRFKNSIDELNVQLTNFKSFPDHHRYSKNDVANLQSLAEKQRARCLLTTEKDLVKLADSPWSLPIFALRMEITVSPSFDEKILAGLKKTAFPGLASLPQEQKASGRGSM